MKVTFFGAAQTVTGSCYIIEAAGYRFAIDCGMHQGNKAIEARNSETDIYRPESIDFILLTHAHIDHSGLLPRIGANGFSGSIYCTEPTMSLVELMLEDSAHIQEMEFQWKLKKKSRKGKRKKLKDQPLYTMQDAKKVLKQLEPIEFDRTFEPAPNIKVTYKYAAHILGAAFINLEITERDTVTRLTFSGDLGRSGALLLHDPDTPEKPDYLFVESTYGDRNHKGEDSTHTELLEAIQYSYRQKGKVLIPTFAVERAQEIIYSLYLLKKQGHIPDDMPIFLDSPLAIRATDVFFKHAHDLNIKDGNANPFDTENNELNIHFTLSTEESQALNLMSGPAIILSASGMCNAGRIKHHLKHCIWRPETSLVFVGYQAVETLGRKIVEGAKRISIFNEQYKVAAKIFTIGGFSAHADQSQILDWVGALTSKKTHVVLTHGEIKAQKTLAKLVKEKLHLQSSIPNYLDDLILNADSKPTLIQNITSTADTKISHSKNLYAKASYSKNLYAKVAHSKSAHSKTAHQKAKHSKSAHSNIAHSNLNLISALQQIEMCIIHLQEQFISLSSKSNTGKAKVYKRMKKINHKLSELLSKL